MRRERLTRDYWPEPPSEPPVTGVEIVQMRLDQLDEIVALEEESFPTPWSKEAFEYDLTQNTLAHYWTLLKRKVIIGYAGIWLVGNIAHVTTICIRQKDRGKGLGEWFLLKVMAMGSELGAQRFTLEVRESNEEALELYRKVGFREVGRRENYYQEIGEDALVMWTGEPPYET